jgi:hypothetical protein
MVESLPALSKDVGLRILFLAIQGFKSLPLHHDSHIPARRRIGLFYLTNLDNCIRSGKLSIGPGMTSIEGAGNAVRERNQPSLR